MSLKKSSSKGFEDDGHCFACGSLNPRGLKLKFKLESDGSLSTSFTPRRIYQGFKDVTHGGILGLIFDEMMVNLPLCQGKKAVSAEYKVRLLKPVPVGERVEFRSRVREEKGRLIYLVADARTSSGTRVAEAEGTCVRLK
ncbi:MAG: PaaI family thioesterase [Candidatus Omnitrophica bacterium]|nr:PaaI family thioesterase [Candidatus Omnitrophota bacterium]